MFNWFSKKKGESGTNKSHVSGPFREWLAEQEEMKCVAEEVNGSKILLVTSRRLVMLMKQGREVTDSEEVLWKNFVSVRLHKGTRRSRLDVSIKGDSGDISIWHYEGIKKNDAATAYQHLKHKELTEKEKPPKKKEEKKPPPSPHIVLRLDTNNIEVNDDGKKEGGKNDGKPAA